jgi:uncharacterized RDD family membrane protein YckC
VGFAEKAWAVGVLGGKPAMLTSRTPEGDGKSDLIGFVRDAGSWKQFFTCTVGYPPTTVGFVGGDDAAFQILCQSVPWSLNVIRVKGDKVLSRARFDGAFPFRKAGSLLVFLPPLSAMFAPVLFALVLSRLMQKYRERFYSGAGAPIPYASLARRVGALAIDAAIAVGPLAAALGYALSFFADLEDNPSESRMALVLALIVGGLAWAGIALILFTYSTGRWGRTPGKSALGIRVLSGDLQPCGFGRAVLRTLLLLPDAFLNFMVGILLIAFTAHWQRLGDLAAKTIVVREVGGQAG